VFQGDCRSGCLAAVVLDRTCTILPGVAGAEAAGRRGRQRRAADGPARLGPAHWHTLLVTKPNSPGYPSVLTAHVADAQLKLGRLFGPMLERRGRSDRLRKMLTFYDQNKFFFNLPASLKAAIDRVRPLHRTRTIAQDILTGMLRRLHWGRGQDDYEQAVRDVRRGRQAAVTDRVVRLLDGVSGQCQGSPSSPPNAQ